MTELLGKEVIDCLPVSAHLLDSHKEMAKDFNGNIFYGEGRQWLDEQRVVEAGERLFYLEMWGVIDDERSRIHSEELEARKDQG